MPRACWRTSTSSPASRPESLATIPAPPPTHAVTAAGNNVQRLSKGDFFGFFLFMYIQHFFICRPSESIVSENAGIEPRTTLAVTSRRSNHLARSPLHLARSHPFLARSHPLLARSRDFESNKNPPLHFAKISIFMANLAKGRNLCKKFVLSYKHF